MPAPGALRPTIAMLTHLHLRDFAIVDRLELELGAGLTVLTGETGAGKSILIDALNLALGERAHSALVRPGASKAEIGAVFAPEPGSAAAAWLAGNELDEAGGECLLRRTVNRDGRSRAYVNGRPVPVQSLRSLGDLLVDIHGQHAHQSLLRRDVQREIVDARAGDREGVEGLAASYRRHARLVREMESESLAGGEDADRSDLLAWQIRELEAANPSAREFDDLLAEHRMQSHRADLLTATHRALEALDSEEGPSAVALAAAAGNEVAKMAPYFPEGAAELQGLIEGALIQLQEAAGTMRRTRDRFDPDPARLAELDARLAELHALARKHRVEARGLDTLLARLRREQEALAQGAARRGELRTLLEAAAREYAEISRRVHASRLGAAEALGSEIEASLQQLGMRHARFRVGVSEEPDRPPSPHGADRIEFLVSANPGQPLRPVAQVASGGELSRISLAIQASASRHTGVSTLIFDEVDSGIGARVAGIVGHRLRALSRGRQVLCVTHLPQIASQAHHHIAVEKRASGDETRTRTHPVSGEQRVHELARMLAGTEPTSKSLAHAREMLGQSSEPRPLPL